MCLAHPFLLQDVAALSSSPLGGRMLSVSKCEVVLQSEDTKVKAARYTQDTLKAKRKELNRRNGRIAGTP